MIRHRSDLSVNVTALFENGAALPAHPLALNEQRQLDTARQRALTRYYMDAGADGVAVGVHTTQFAIREVGLYPTVLRIAADAVRDWSETERILVAGVTGKTDQALAEIDTARGLGYHAALVNLARLKGSSEAEVLEHCRRLAKEMPIIGFALLPAVGGFHLSYGFWRQFAGIENVIAIKMAPFDRYRTIDIVRAVHDAGASDRVTLYTGNDDHIGLDLLVPFVVRSDDGRGEIRARIKGGLLGHWSVWTSSAVAFLNQVHATAGSGPISQDMLAMDSIITDCNGAIYDAHHDLKGAIPGCLEVLRRQGLVEGTWCLDPAEILSPGQNEAIDRVYRQYPEMNDDAFVRANLDRWLSERGQTIPLIV